MGFWHARRLKGGGARSAPRLRRRAESAGSALAGRTAGGAVWHTAGVALAERSASSRARLREVEKCNLAPTPADLVSPSEDPGRPCSVGGEAILPR